MAVILICSSLPQQGKDTATKFLEENYNGIRIAFADKVKEIAKLMEWNGEKDEKGRKIKVRKKIKKYNVNILPPLTPKELEELKQAQMMRDGIK